MAYSTKTRWLLIIGGCLVAAAGVAALGLDFAFYPAILIAGAVVHPRFHNLGRGLICAGALLVTFWACDIAYFTLTERPSGLSITVSEIAIYILAALIAACDASIVREELRIRRSGSAAKGQPSKVLTTND